MLGTLPELDLVSIRDLKFHEHPDQHRVVKICENLRQTGKLINPPLVARINKFAGHLIIDGANRITALRETGHKSALVQIIDIQNPDLRLDRWHHVLQGLDSAVLLKLTRRIPGLRLMMNGSVSLPNKLFSIHFSTGSHYTAHSDFPPDEQTAQLQKFFTLYRSDYFLDRVSYTDFKRLHTVYKGFVALIKYKTLDKQQLISMVRQNILLPSGITRFIMPQRALGCNFALKLLKDDKTVQERKEILTEFLAQKLRDHKIRFYAEPTFHFDN